ncbi:calcium-binding protein [Rhizobacter sp. Root1221]|uniref:calcium-binding protein n=1 Tax=Rhizobacter sp. Root1221 TaxID=1736433 RepID=UPI0007004969|nr:calcium-binding protein [Rhizobacter sp. Root1221]KQV92819.1 hypothetical protein ASC87_27530 [Rhizobacter sp. Root1221]
MVAIVSGNTLGVSLTSLATLGQRGGLSGSAGQGRSGELVYVNAASGNLVLQNRDDLLAGRGRDAVSVRTYNSQGQSTDDNGDNWSHGIFLQQLQLNGTRNAVDSTLVRTDRDGAQAVYTFDMASGRYVTAAGAGAFDTISYDEASGQYAWLDGNAGDLERYEAATGRLLQLVDTSGNTLSYAYDNAGRLASVTTASGEATYLDYSGNNLAQLRTVVMTDTGSQTLTRTRYTYDTADRLSSVIVDLSPEDNGVADGNVYVTTYTYDGTSKRVATVGQSDGTSLSIWYVQVGSEYRVASLTDGSNQTTLFDYDTVTHRTTVTDPLGLLTVYGHDANGQLSSVTAPSVGGVSQVTSFGYDTDGNLVTIEDPAGRAVEMGYDDRGNQVMQRDGVGNTVSRVYDSRNQLVSETVYLVPDADGDGPARPSAPQSTHYVYDAAGRNRLRFVITAEGRVTEHRYDGFGNRIETLQYSGERYEADDLAIDAVPAELSMEYWARVQDPSRTGHVVRTFDFRGQVERERAFGVADENGVVDVIAQTTRYVYDQAGRLLTSIGANGGLSTYTYDGLGRVLTFTDAAEAVTLNAYDDANQRTSTRLDNGLVTTSTFDAAGRLTSVVQSGDAGATLGETRYHYDADGRLVMSTDATGVSRWSLHDDAGRKVGDVDADGTLTEYVYHANNLLAGTIIYATRMQTALLVDAGGNPEAVSLADLRPAGSAANQREWRIYDAANRLVQTVDAEGYVTQTTYDGASRVIAVTRYDTPVAVPAASLSPILAAFTVSQNVAKDRTTRTFHDGDGRVVGELDAENYYTHYEYDGAGRLIAKTKFASPMVGALVDAHTPPAIIAEGTTPPATAYVRERTQRASPLPPTAGTGSAGVVDAKTLLAKLEAFKAVDQIGAFTDLVRLVREAGPTLKAAGFDATALLRRWVRALPAGSPVFETLESLRVRETGEGADAGDILFGSTEGDQVRGYEGDDVIAGGLGSDTLGGGAGNDTLDGGVGSNDFLEGGLGADTYLYGYGYGDDVITITPEEGPSLATSDVIQLGVGVQPGDVALSRSYGYTGMYDLTLTLLATGERLTIEGYYGNAEWIRESRGIRAIRFSDGTEWDALDVDNRVALGTDEEDTLDSVAPGTLQGGRANDSLTGTYDAEAVYGGRGNDTLQGSGGSDVVVGGSGNDTLHGDMRDDYYGGDDTLDGGSGDDYLFGASGRDVYVFGIGSGRDTIGVDDRGWNMDRYANGDTLRLGDGIKESDLLFGRDSQGGLLISLRNSSDSILVENYFVDLENPQDWYGGFAKGLEYIEFADGTVWNARQIQSRLRAPVLKAEPWEIGLVGGEGADSILAFGGYETLDGAAGNDTLSGMSGDDVYEFGLGSGRDVIIDRAEWSGYDTIRFREPILPADVTLRRVGDSLEVIFSNRDMVTVEKHFLPWAYPSNDIEAIEFADGTVWDATEIANRASYTTNLPDVVRDGSYDGGEGADSLAGGDEANLLVGGAGRDSLDGENGNDTLDGGIGSDWLHGGVGADAYRFNRGGGRDTIDNISGEASQLGHLTGDVLALGGGIVASDVVLSRVGDDLVLSLIGTDDSVTFSRYFVGDLSGEDIRVETIRFHDGSEWSVDDVEARLLVDAGGGAGNDLLDGATGSNMFEFERGWGNDTIANFHGASTASNQIRFAADVSEGDVRVSRVGDTLIIVRKNTSDRIEVRSFFSNRAGAGSGASEILFGNSTAWDYETVVARVTATTDGDDRIEGDAVLAGGKGDDTLVGHAGSDAIDGGSGDDLLDGASGNDTYRFGWGSGRDTIVAGGAGQGDFDVVEFSEGIEPGDLRIDVRQGAVIVTLGNGVDRLTIGTVRDGVQGPLQVREFRFFDGSVWDEAKIRAVATTATADDAEVEGLGLDDTLTGSFWSDTLAGLDGDDVLLGGHGFDMLQGGAGDDTLDGGTGDDSLDGGTGRNTYYLGRGSGHDEANFIHADGSTFHVIQLAADVRPSEVLVEYDGSGARFTIIGTNDYIDGYDLPDEVHFADGTIWDRAAMDEAATRSTWGLSDQASEGVAYDYDAGNDVFVGSPASDTFFAGTGDDTFVFGPASGRDSIQLDPSAWGSGDSIQIAEGVQPADLIFSRDRWSDSGLVIAIRNAPRAILQINSYLSTNESAEPPVIRFADGTEWTRADVLQRLVTVRDDTIVLNNADARASGQLLLRQVGNDLEITGLGSQLSSRLGGWYAANTTHVDQYAGGGTAILGTAGDADLVDASLQGRDQTTRLIYDALGQLVGEVDAENYLTEHVYNEAGQRTKSIRYSRPLTVVVQPGMKLFDMRPSYDAQARVSSLTYDLLGRVYEEVDAEGTITQYTYDNVGHLVSTKRGIYTEESRTNTAHYDQQGRLVGELSGEGSRRLYSGQTQEEIDLVWAQFGLKHAYDAAGRRTSTTDANGHRTVFYYDVDGRIRFTVNALGEVEERRYNALNQLEATVQLNNRVPAETLATMTGGVADEDVEQAIAGFYDLARDSVTGYTYTVRGQVESTTDALHHSTAVKYNAFGQVERTTSDSDNLGGELVQESSYDRRGLQTASATDPDGINATASTRYDAFGRAVRSVDANGNVTQQSFDRVGRVVQTLDATNAVRSSTWDAFDRVLSTTDALGHTTTYAYSDLGRSVIVTTPEGVSVKTVHNQHGQTQDITDADGNVTQFVYDGDGRLTLTVDAKGATAQNMYDVSGRLTETRDARGVITSYTYDAVNRVLTRTVDPQQLNLATTYAYDAKGRQHSVTDPRGVVTTVSYDLAGHVLKQVVDAEGAALTTEYTYDPAGRVLTVTDPSQHVTQYSYDKLGRRTGSVVDLGGENIATGYDYDNNGNLLFSTDALGKVTRFAYDAMGRLVFTVDPVGGLTHVEYDAEGRAVRTTVYAKPVPNAASLPTQLAADTIAALLPALATPGRDAITAQRYDGDGRVTFTVDATGAVVEFRYDARGNVSERIAYATAIDFAAWDGGSDPSPVAGALDRHVFTRYDQLNRAVRVMDATGAVTRSEYDEVGNLVRQTQLATRAENGADPEGLGPSAADRVSVFLYDMAGRLAATTDPTGAVTQNTYDDNGNLVKQTRFATPIGAGTDPRMAVGNAADDRVTQFEHDGANRTIKTVDADGYVTTTAYDAMGRVTSNTRYAEKPVLAGGEPPVTPGRDQTTTFAYDGAGRLTSTTDALNQTERWTYDARGNKLTFTNKKQSVWHYEYDARGRMTKETSPPVTLTEVTQNARGDLVESTTTTDHALVTTMAYDALGNLLSRTEAKDRPEERTTSYAYDAMGRQIQVTHPPVRVYNEALGAVLANGVGGSATRVEAGAQALTTKTTYDAFGDAVINVDVAGSVSFKVYDKAGRVRFDVDALGQVTEYARNAFGDATEIIRYGRAHDVPRNGAGAVIADQPLTAVALETAIAGPLGSGVVRRIETEFDAFGRALVVREPEVFTVDSAADTSAEDGRKVTRNEYDAFGSLVRVSALRSGNESAGTWADTYQYYDVLGRLSDKVDALGYRSTNTYDAFGNLASTTDFATKQLGSWDIHSAGTVVADDDFDRRVEFVYDGLNRKVKETRKLLESSSTTQALAGVSTRGDATTEYGYDAVGNLTRTTDPLGQSTYSYFDALGRVTAVAAPSRAGGDGTTVLTPLSLFRRDAYGNVVVKVDLAKGARGAVGEFQGVSNRTQLGALVGDFDEAADRTTLSAYDLHGHAVQSTDAAGYSTFNSYNARGQLAKTWQGVTSGTPTLDAFGKLKADSTVFKVYEYDALGQLTHTYDPGPATQLVYTGTPSVSGRLTARTIESSATVEIGETQNYFTRGNAVRISWYDVVDPAGDSIRVEFDYLTSGSNGYLVAGEGRTYTKEFAAAASVNGIYTDWWDGDMASYGVSAIQSVRVWQKVNGTWTKLWDDATAGTASETPTGYLTTAAAPQLIATDLGYNAFGEMVSRGLQGGQQEYFDYDAAGRLWRTNSGDGIDKIYLYDQLGNVVSELRSDGSSGQNRDLKQFASAEQAVASGTLRRSATVYDALGRVIETRGVDRGPARSGVTGQPQAPSVNVSSSSAPTVVYLDESASVVWSGNNTVALGWADLSHLGSGDLKVEIIYQTAVYQSSPGSVDESGNYVGGYTPAETRTFDAVFTAEQAATGVSLTWADTGLVSTVSGTDESGTPVIHGGGVGSVSVIRISKRDPEGNWQVLHDATPGTAVKVLDVSALFDPNTELTLEIRAAGSQGDWIKFPQDPVRFTQALRFNLAALTEGDYEYRVQSSVGDSAAKTINAGVIRPDGTVASHFSASNATRPTVEQILDRWGNVVSISDPRMAQWVTTYRYNANNQVVSELKPDGAETKVYYDALGHQAATRDGNGNLNGQVFDASGNLVEEHHADGGVVRHAYNAFGDKVRTTNAEGNRSDLQGAAASDALAKNTTTFAYDKMGRLTETHHGRVTVARATDAPDPSHPMQIALTSTEQTDLNVYDQAGRRLSQTTGKYGTGTGETLRYQYDLAGRVVETIQPGGEAFKIRTVYDAQGHKIGEVDQNGNASQWTYDYFGKMTARSDLGGATFGYSYDKAGQLVETTNSRYGTGVQLTNQYNAAGELIKVTDHALNQVTEFSYDLAGRHVREKTTQDGVVYQDNTMGYDEVGRLRHVSDGRMSIDLEYDDAGNRTRVRTHVNVPTLADPTVDVPKDSDRYFTYDAMNRQTGVELEKRADGTIDYVYQFDANGHIVAGTSGHKVSYDLNGNRSFDKYLGTKVKYVPAVPPTYEDGGESGPIMVDPGSPETYVVDHDAPSKEVTEAYAYDALNRLLSVTRDGMEVDYRQYDVVGRVITTGPRNLPPAYAAAMNSGLASGETIGLEYRINRYDANGRLARQQVFNADRSKYLNSIDYTGYDAAGNLKSYSLTSPNNYTNVYTYQQAKFDGYKEGSVHGESEQFHEGTTDSHYDVNGNLVSVDDHTKNENDRSFVNDLAGHALYVKQGTAVQRQVVVNGEVLGRYGVGINEMNPRNSEGNPVFTELADFNFGYQPITGNYPTASVGSYQVKAGDSLRSIARQSYGDEGLWYRIAETNGLSGDRDLRVGQTINIPSVVGTVRNNSETYKPYDPSKITGDTTPNMPVPNGGGAGCGGIGMLLVIIVAVVVTVFTAGAAAMAMAGGVSAFSTAATAGTLMSTMAAAGTAAMTAGTLVGAVAAGIGAAVGSIVSQGVAMAVGLQEEFSWKQVGMSALGGAVSAALPGAAFAGVPGGPAAQMAVRAAVSNAVTQGVGVATGLQDKFNWRGVAASAAAAFVSQGLTDLVMGDPVSCLPDGSIGRVGGLAGALGGGEFGKIAGSTVLGLAAGVTAAAVRGGKVVVQQVTVDAFGNALGDSLAGQMSAPGQTAEPDTVGPISAEERASILAMFSDGPGGEAVPLRSSVFGKTFAEDRAVREVLNNPYGRSFGRGEPVATGPVEFNPLDGFMKWELTGEKPIYDFGDPLESLGRPGELTASKGGGSTSRTGGGGSTRLPVQMAVNARAATLADAMGEVSGLVPEATRDIKQIVAILDEAKRLELLEKVQGALRERLGVRVMPSPGALGVSPSLSADADGAGRTRYDTSELIDHYTDALRKVGLAQQGAIELDYRTFEIKTIGNQRLTPSQYQAENEVRYQKAFESAVELGEARYESGKLPYPKDMPKQLQVGLFADGVARNVLVDYNKTLGVPEGPGQVISLNRWAYDMQGSGNYVRPDVLFDFGPKQRSWLDGKTSLTGSQTTTQFENFYKYTGATSGKVITRNGPVPIAHPNTWTRR